MTLFVNGLTHLDASLWCSTRGLIGVSWQVNAELDGELGEDGMLFDFGQVKPWIKSRLDDSADHTLIVPTEAPGVTVSECSEGLVIRTTTPYAMEVRGPHQAFTLVPWTQITPTALAEHFSEQMLQDPPPRVSAIRLSFEDEVLSGAAYTYSHGLRRHSGNCQRIAHGHRSPLHIWQAGKRAPALEADWAERLADRYLVDASDILDDPEAAAKGELTTRYRAPQGEFFLRLPRERCVTLPTATTIEQIAAWLAKKVAGETGEATRVQAFEGIGKGAIAERMP
ncbi:6-pyruvoyl tetrahydropterin synthase [Onishia taeanensis]|uniref:6-carboxy-5,6,7,8-tetrahydropterin synthase n=1 Tax=Onishia taeanensis TaxID=284577 RepID=A0A1G7V693_9GAMM|nr:6-carboxytetrahydropterin synthase [Halomonas taeanensis]SDG55405.1 6-pyruvoyl tetrahydropterin synthase [Halomonas taeanensis]